MPFEVKDVDRRYYQERLAEFLPARLIDVHTHVWLQSHVADAPATSRGPTWPSLVAAQSPAEELLATYRLMFPQQEVLPVIFGSARAGADLTAENAYVSQAAHQYRLPALLVSHPAWTAEGLARRVREGGFLGLKPYLSFAPPHIASGDITIYDYLPRHQLEVADAHNWIIMLHIPRRERLKDPLNLRQMLEIERDYPHVRLIIAHIGRAYCIEDVGNAFDVLRETERMRFDFSANTNPQVMRRLIRAVGPKRILFGSDLPILRMRMRRICENGAYVNLVPPGLYGDVSGDPHMRAVSAAEGERLSFFMYEELSAFRRAAEATALTRAEVEDVFYGNAAHLVAEARRTNGT